MFLLPLRPYTILAAFPRHSLYPSVQYPCGTEAPKTAHRTWAEAASVYCRVGQSPFSSSWWYCAWIPLHPRTQLTLFVDPYSTFHQPRPPDFFLWCCCPAFCPLCAYRQGYPTTDRESALVLLTSLAVVPLSGLSTCLCRASLPSRNFTVFPASKLGLFWQCSWSWSNSCCSWKSSVTQMCSHLPRGLGRRIRRKTKK